MESNNKDNLKINISMRTYKRLQDEKPSSVSFDYFINSLLDKYCEKLKIEDGEGSMKLVKEEDIDAFRY